MSASGALSPSAIRSFPSGSRSCRCPKASLEFRGFNAIPDRNRAVRIWISTGDQQRYGVGVVFDVVMQRCVARCAVLATESQWGAHRDLVFEGFTMEAVALEDEIASAVICLSLDSGVQALKQCVFRGIGIRSGLLRHDRPVPACHTARKNDRRNRQPAIFHDVARAYKEDSPSYGAILHTLTTNPQDLVRHLGQQIHANATVAQRKYRWANRATQALLLGLLALGALAAIIALNK
jgi:pycsar effector protein